MTTMNDQNFWDRIAGKYASDPIKDIAGYERTLDRTAEFLGAGSNVLELGCGTGTTALRLAGGTASYLGTDISSEMIELARQKLRETPVPELSFRQATAETLMLEEGTCDAVLGFSYLHLVRDLPGTLATIRRLTKPGGVFISKTPCLADMNPLIRLALPPMRLLGKAPFVTVFSAQGLERAITAAGFEIVANELHASKGKDTRPFIVARSH